MIDMRCVLFPIFALLCASFFTSSLTAKKPAQSHLVVVWHINAHEVWVGRGPKAALLEAAVLGRCNKVMGGGCTIARSEATGFVAVARRADGMLGTSRGDTAAAASAEALSFCQQTPADRCRVEEVLQVAAKSAKMSFLDPADREFLIRRYGAIVWQRPTSPPTRLWIATGRATPQLAENDALANCKADVGAGCELAQTGANTTMVAFMDGSRLLHIMQGRDLEDALKEQVSYCAENALTCKTQLVVNAAAKDTSVFAVRP